MIDEPATKPATIQRAYKTKLVTNNREANYFRGCAGLARFVYNWGLAEAGREYEATGKTPSPRNVLKRRFNAIKVEQFPWTAEYPYVIVQSAFDDLDAAFKNFFRRVKAGQTPGYPRFKARGRDMSFRFVGAGIAVEAARVKLPRIGWVRLAERGYLPSGAEINSATISWRAGNWYVSVQVEEKAPEPVELRPVTLGVELGIRLAAVATAADREGNLVGAPTVYENPRVLDKHARKLARLSRELSRRRKGGANWRKTQAKIARQYERITRARDYAQHNVSADIVRRKRPAEIVIAGHEVADMMKRPEPVEAEGGGFERNEAEVTRPRRRKMADARMGELRRQVEYKAGWAGIAIERPEAGYPATRMCSTCGFINAELPLRETVLRCAGCGARIDRDVNAARNLAARREPVKHGGLPGELGEQSPTVNQEAGAPE